MNESAAPRSRPMPLALLLGAISFATVAFLLCVFRLLSFFIMPSLFFDLLFIGFPIGAYLGARYFRITPGDFARSLLLLHAIMLVSILLCLLCKQADYLRATFYDLKTRTLLVQMAVFSLMFLPFFCAYGLSEYLGYQVGRTVLRRRMRGAYAAYLFGAAAAYVAVHVGLSWIGVARVMLLSVAMVLAAAISLLRRPLWLAELAGLVALACWPGLEARFLDLYKGVYGGYRSGSITSTKGLTTRTEEDPERPGVIVPEWSQIYQRWGRYALCEIVASRHGNHLAGFYNDVFQWSYTRPVGIPYATLDALPFMLVPEGGRVVIIGSGGGRQVRWAEQFGRLREIVAVDLESEVFQITRARFPDKFDRVYEQPTVTPVRSEGRTYLTHAAGSFDLIFMPSVGGYAQMMLEPGNMIRTYDAYRLMRERLTPRGVLAVWYPKGLDPHGILTRQYIDTFRMLGLHANWYENVGEVLIISSPVREQSFLPEPLVLAFFSGQSGPFFQKSPDQQVPRRIVYAGDPGFTPITDEKPFLAGNVRHIFTLQQVGWIFGALAAGFLVLAVVLAFLLRRGGDPRIPGVPYPLLVVMSLLVGANFLVMEHALVIALFRQLYVFYDAVILGAIGYLVLTGLGSMLVGARFRTAAYGLFVVSCLAFPWVAEHASAWYAVLAMSPAAFVLGSFFPALFEAAERNPLTVFAMDALGAAIGALCAFFVPIVFGLSRLLWIATGLGLCTLLGVVIVLWLQARAARAGVSECEPAAVAEASA